MKRCPECFRDYFDETLNFCLDDGTHLLAGPFTGQLDPTVIYPTLPDPISSAKFSLSERQAADANVQLNTIAVLPFLNLSRGDEDDYFSDGLAEELLNVLSKIRGLRVAARTSAFSV